MYNSGHLGPCGVGHVSPSCPSSWLDRNDDIPDFANVFICPSYEHVTSVTLSLPLTPALTFCTILLPLFAAGNLLSLRYLWPHRSKSSNRRIVVKLSQLLLSPIILQTLQAIFTTILATLYFTDLVPTNTALRDCKLATQWQHLFHIKDARSIRTIQDALQCCGFRSVRDMAWPFAGSVSDGEGGQCAAMFDRTRACRVPWAAALQRSAGVNFGVVLAVGVLQVSVLCFFSQRHDALFCFFSSF